MDFNSIIGQEEAKQRLMDELQQGRVAHALMLCGPEGCGALPLAIAYAKVLLGNSPLVDRLQTPTCTSLSLYTRNTATRTPIVMSS